MRILLDTCSFLWLVVGSRRLSARARQEFEQPENEIYLSAASAWEIAVKHRLARLPLPAPPAQYVPSQREAHGIQDLPIDEEAALYVSWLPELHRDPFDRLLVAQATVHGLTLLTPDDAIRQYAVRSLW